jgi:hypothetical protein
MDDTSFGPCSLTCLVWVVLPRLTLPPAQLSGSLWQCTPLHDKVLILEDIVNTLYLPMLIHHGLQELGPVVCSVFMKVCFFLGGGGGLLFKSSQYSSFVEVHCSSDPLGHNFLQFSYHILTFYFWLRFEDFIVVKIHVVGVLHHIVCKVGTQKEKDPNMDLFL